MITNKDVFAKRKQGAIDEAYQMALQLMSAPQVDDWDYKALGWCLIDLIKRDAQAGIQENLTHYRQQLESIKVDPKDDVLQKGINNALLLCSQHGRRVNEAKKLSKEGRHADAVAILRELRGSGEDDVDIATNLGWGLYQLCRQLMDSDNVNFDAVKRNLNEYLKLEIEKPSLLHTCILQIATKLAEQDKLNMLAFSRLWNLESLRTEDFDRYRSEDGKMYPSLAEKVIQKAGKEAAASANVRDLNYILPHIDKAIENFTDNVWLKLNKAKVLLGLGRHDDALTFGVEVTKAKMNDYWAWELLGDICTENEQKAVLSCYCKAMLCSHDDQYTNNLRLKLAQRMVDRGDFSAAKYEVGRVLSFKEKESQKIPEIAAEIASQTWYSETQPATSNLDYYKAHASDAELLMFSNMPWINAVVGDSFIAPGNETQKPKKRRRIFVETSSVPMEVGISESKFEYGNLTPGSGLRLKGDFDSAKRFQVYVIEKRNSDAQWDIFSGYIGVVDHVNNDKGVLHYIFSRDIDGVIPLSELATSFTEGDAIAVKLSRYRTKDGFAYRTIAASATDKVPSTQLKKHFRDFVEVSNGMGFTNDDIFIPPPLVKKHQITDGYMISGTALLSYNKKRSSWGWRAISIEQEGNPPAQSGDQK